jgi:regulator of replication initiation timing
LKEIRKIIAENQSLKDENSVLKQQATDYQAQSVQYNELYKQEKHRADVIQGNRIKNLESQLGERALQINALRQQANDDREYISRLEFDKQKLKGKVKTSFWKGFATGGTAGAAGGAVVGYKLGNKDPSFRLAGINF